MLLAGGGTGGHLYPALTIADEIKKLAPGTEFLFIGTKNKIEARVVPQRGYPFRTIWISGFHRRLTLTLSNLLFPVKVLASLVQSFFLKRSFQPDVAIGTGGYVCGPVLWMASMLGVPVVLHESNSYPGATTRMLADRAANVMTAFEQTKQWLKRSDNVELIGTPTREVLGTVTKEARREFFKLDSAKKTVFVFGGSLGAASINNAMLNILDELQANDIQLIWQTGQSDYERVRAAVGIKKNVWLGAFIDQIEHAYAAADVVVCRSGALTIAELTNIGLPAILVPYPHAAADHQTVNARSLVDAGAAVMVRDSEVESKLQTELFNLLNDAQRRASMSQASKRLGKPGAGKEIAKRILELVR